MPRNAYGSFPKADSNPSGGYGTIKPHAGEKQAGAAFPYVEITPEEEESNNDDSEDDDRHALDKKVSRPKASDRLQQLNYHTGAYVNGATRGLTGIMSGKEAQAVMEAYFNTPTGQALGSADPSRVMNRADIFRTRPNRGIGSKKGWFSPPSPKTTDPDPREYTLRGIGEKDIDEPVKKANIIRKREKALNRATEGTDLLRRYVRLALRGA